MLSVKKIAAADGAALAGYYENLAREDYYTAGGEPPGEWHGKGAEALGLSGQIEKGQLLSGMQGFHPQTGEALARNAGQENRAPGWDCTFSAPKSVSAVWAVASEDERKAISEAHRQAVKEALDYLQKEAVFTRHGAGGEDRRHTTGITASMFEHSTSRNGDPQLHTHAILLNMDPEGRGLDLDTRWKMAAGAVYRAVLADKLAGMGFGIEKDGKSFRIAGIPDDLIEKWSSRRAEVLKAAREHGVTTAEGMAVAALASRQEKGEIDRQALFKAWQETAREMGFGKEQIDQLKTLEHPSTLGPMPTREEMLAKLTEQASTVSEMQLQAAVFQEAQGRIGADEAQAYIQALKNDPQLIHLHDTKTGERRYTSQEMWEIEKRIGDRAERWVHDKTFGVDQNLVHKAAEAKNLTPEQRLALDHITAPGRIAVLQGVAGAGKSYTMDAARQVWEGGGYKVLGCAFQGQAAEMLQDGSKIESSTIHSLLHQIESGKLVLDNKTVVVLDEGGMVGSRLMDKLEQRLDEAGAKLVIAGDTQQIQPIDAGGAMRATMERVGYHQNDEIFRQQSAEERAAGRLFDTGPGADERKMVLNFRDGKIDEALDYLRGQGRLIVHKTREDLEKAVSQEIVKNILAGRDHIAMFDTNSQTNRVNEMVRGVLKEKGLLQKDADAKFQTFWGDKPFQAGDKVIFRDNNKALGVKNGTLGVVQKATTDRLWIKTQKGLEVEIHASSYNKINHSYSLTINKSQGASKGGADYSPSSFSDREKVYVGMSRHKEVGEARMHITSEMEKDLKKVLEKSNIKNTSQSYNRHDHPRMEPIPDQVKRDAELAPADNPQSEKGAEWSDLAKDLAKSEEKDLAIDHQPKRDDPGLEL